SSTLIDSPAASKLGENRALYYSEEENRIEKFRPYGLPEPGWLEAVKQRFAARPRPAVVAGAHGEGTPPAGDGAGAHGNGPAPGGHAAAGGEPTPLIESRAPEGDEAADPTIEGL